MWGALQNPGHVAFYEDWHTGNQQFQMDWMPMVRAVQYLQAHPSAPELFAFTSLSRLHLTTAPIYQDCDSHCSVSVVWRCSERVFHLAFGQLADGWADDRHPEVVCDESSFGGSIQPLIQRLLSSRPPQVENHNGEQGGAGQPATRPVDKPEGGDKPQPEAEGRSR
jgi:hypothetical protein